MEVLRVLQAADARAGNPFESVLRAIGLDVPGLYLVPQVEIRIPGRRRMRPDLVDRRLKIVVEADSFEHRQRLPRTVGARLCPVRQPRRRRLDRASVRLGTGHVRAGVGAFDPPGRHRPPGLRTLS